MHLEPVRERIARAAAREGRDPSSIRIVAVTKGHPLAAVQEALDAGLPDVGENRVQEALEKMDAWTGASVRWHLIGHLQTNKAKRAVGRFALIHSVDSVRIADALAQAAAQRGLVQDVLVQVNTAGEAQKSGSAPAEAEALALHVARAPGLRLCGLMAMAPLTDDAAVVRAAFRGLRELGERLGSGTSPLPAPRVPLELSMGMSSDFEIAVEEGATLLRLGTVLFGERQQ